MIRISILLPTRGRPDHLRRSISSLADFAARPEEIEVLLAVDEDDALAPTDAIASEFQQLGSVRILRGPRHGYRGAQHYWNGLFAISTGDVLVSWNDDCEMLTIDWDRLLLDGPAYSVQFPRRDIMETADTTIPCTRRAVYEAMGHVCLNPYGDAWMNEVSKGAGIAVFRDDVVFHHHRLNDQTTQDIREGVDWVSDFDSEEMRAARAEDIKRVLEKKS